MNLAALISSILTELISSIESIDVDSKDIKVNLKFKKTSTNKKEVKSIKSAK